MSGETNLFLFQLRAAKIPYCTEHRFHPTRKWRFDFAVPDAMLAVEIDGGLFVNGGHSRGAARRYDMEKDAEAMLLGWRVLRAPPEWVKPGTLLAYVEQILKSSHEDSK